MRTDGGNICYKTKKVIEEISDQVNEEDSENIVESEKLFIQHSFHMKQART